MLFSSFQKKRKPKVSRRENPPPAAKASAEEMELVDEEAATEMSKPTKCQNPVAEFLLMVVLLF